MHQRYIKKWKAFYFLLHRLPEDISHYDICMGKWYFIFIVYYQPTKMSIKYRNLLSTLVTS